METSDHKDLQFSLFFFSANEASTTQRKYDLLLESVKYADHNGFTAVWIPERHFHAFGGLYPNPSVIGAALATITENIQIRAGSVVVPLQNPLRVAEEWAVIDNLSNGRTGISFAPGWNVNDFVLAPETFDRRKELMFESIENVQKLWQGESLSMPNGVGNRVDIKISPRPVQQKLPIWLTCASTSTFAAAGRMGANVLTSLLEEDVDVLERQIKIYHEARLHYGHHPEEGHVTLMLHTYLGKDRELTKAQAKPFYLEYIRMSIEQQAIHARGLGMEIDPQKKREDAIDYLASQKFELLCGQRGLIGTIDTCVPLLDHLRKIGVSEVACLIDFIDNFEVAINSLSLLNELKMICNTQARRFEEFPDDQSLGINQALVQNIDTILADMQAGRIDLQEAQTALDQLQQ